jgi:hypothetical protein
VTGIFDHLPTITRHVTGVADQLANAEFVGRRAYAWLMPPSQRRLPHVGEMSETGTIMVIGRVG